MYIELTVPQHVKISIGWVGCPKYFTKRFTFHYNGLIEISSQPST